MFLADPGFWTPLDLLADKVCAPIHWYSLYLFLLVVTVVIYVHYTYSWRKSIHPVMLYMNTNRMTQAKLAHGEIQTRRQLITTHEYGRPSLDCVPWIPYLSDSIDKNNTFQFMCSKMVWCPSYLDRRFFFPHLPQTGPASGNQRFAGAVKTSYEQLKILWDAEWAVYPGVYNSLLFFFFQFSIQCALIQFFLDNFPFSIYCYRYIRM